MNLSKAFLRPFSFLTIKHESGIFSNVLWKTPIIIASIISIVLLIFPSTLQIIGEKGLIDKITDFIKNLPGFYIAALAAVATFGSKNLNRVMPGSPPRMDIYFNNGTIKNEPLTQRIFLCSMFSYLTTLSFLLSLLGIIISSIHLNIFNQLFPEIKILVKFLFLLIYFTFILQLLIVTAWGIYYLGEKIHLYDRE